MNGHPSSDGPHGDSFGVLPSLEMTRLESDHVTTNQNQMVTSYGLIFISRFENFFNNIFNFRQNRQKFRGGRKPTLENNFEKKVKKG